MQRAAPRRPRIWLALATTALTSGAAGTSDAVTAANIADVIDPDSCGDGRDILVTSSREVDLPQRKLALSL